MEKMCGLSVSSTQVSRLTAELDESFELWRKRPLPEIAHLIIDATYIKVRIDGSVTDCAVFNATPWQRCQFHLQQNAQAYVPKLDMRESVAADIRSVFNADTLALAEAKLDDLVEKYHKSAPDLSNWMQKAIPEGLQVFNLPVNKRTRLRTSNACETLNSQIKRRTRVAGLFPNTDSILRLVTAILMEISEEWEIGKAYLSNQK
jgi:transposase-like protein